MKLNLAKAKEVVKAKTTDQRLDENTGEVVKVGRGRKAKPSHGRFNIFVNKENYKKIKEYATGLDDTMTKHLDIAIEDYVKKIGEL